MNNMLIRLQWKPDDIVNPRFKWSAAQQRKHVAEVVKDALARHPQGQFINVETAFIEDAVVIGYTDVSDYPEEIHDDLLTFIEDTKGSAIVYAAEMIPKFLCRVCDNFFYAGELETNEGYCNSCAESRPMTAEEIEEEKGDIKYHERKDEGLL